MPNDNLSKKNPNFVVELKAKIERQTQEQQQRAETVYKELIEITGSSSSNQETTSVNQAQPQQAINLSHVSDYADLGFSGTFKNIPIKDDTEYAEILFLDSINKAKKLIADIKTADRKIQGIENLKKLNQSASNLAIIEEEIKKSHDDKLILVTKLSEIRGPLNSEFNENFERLQKKETELEERIENTYGDIDKYILLKSELYNTRNEHINLIQKNLDSEQALFEINREDLKPKIEKKLFTLHQTELNLQHKIQKDLRDEKETIERNFELHSKETIEFKQYVENYTKTMDTLVPCEERISILNDKIAAQHKVFQSEEVEFLTIGTLEVKDKIAINKSATRRDIVNPLYIGKEEQEEEQKPLSVDCTKKPSRLAESSFFSSPSSSSNQDAKEKEKISSKGFSYRQ